MLTNDNNRSGLLSAAGVLSIVAGIFQINNGIVLMVFFLTHDIMPYADIIPFLPGFWDDWIDYLFHLLWHDYFPIWLIIVGGLFLVLGILSVVGGISAVRRKSFGLSLAGAICALPSGLLGILTVILVALGKREFGAERKENGI
jgi:hypothetical protein